MNHRMNKYVRSSVILAIVVIVAILTAIWASSASFFPRFPFERRVPPGGGPGIPGDIEFFYTIDTVISTVNVTLSIILFVLYINIYRKTRSEFTIGLTIFSAVFLLNALFSNPFVILIFGFRPFGLGPFALLPGLFTLAALAVLLYLSFRY